MASPSQACNPIASFSPFIDTSTTSMCTSTVPSSALACSFKGKITPSADSNGKIHINEGQLWWSSDMSFFATILKTADGKGKRLVVCDSSNNVINEILSASTTLPCFYALQTSDGNVVLYATPTIQGAIATSLTATGSKTGQKPASFDLVSGQIVALDLSGNVLFNIGKQTYSPKVPNSYLQLCDSSTTILGSTNYCALKGMLPSANSVRLSFGQVWWSDDMTYFMSLVSTSGNLSAVICNASRVVINTLFTIPMPTNFFFFSLQKDQNLVLYTSTGTAPSGNNTASWYSNTQNKNSGLVYYALIRGQLAALDAATNTIMTWGDKTDADWISDTSSTLWKPDLSTNSPFLTQQYNNCQVSQAYIDSNRNFVIETKLLADAIVLWSGGEGTDGDKDCQGKYDVRVDTSKSNNYDYNQNTVLPAFDSSKINGVFWGDSTLPFSASILKDPNGCKVSSLYGGTDAPRDSSLFNNKPYDSGEHLDSNDTFAPSNNNNYFFMQFKISLFNLTFLKSINSIIAAKDYWENFTNCRWVYAHRNRDESSEQFHIDIYDFYKEALLQFPLQQLATDIFYAWPYSAKFDLEPYVDRIVEGVLLPSSLAVILYCSELAPLYPNYASDLGITPSKDIFICTISLDKNNFSTYYADFNPAGLESFLAANINNNPLLSLAIKPILRRYFLNKPYPYISDAGSELLNVGPIYSYGYDMYAASWLCYYSGVTTTVDYNARFNAFSGTGTNNSFASKSDVRDYNMNLSDGIKFRTNATNNSYCQKLALSLCTMPKISTTKTPDDQLEYLYNRRLHPDSDTCRIIYQENSNLGDSITSFLSPYCQQRSRSFADVDVRKCCANSNTDECKYLTSLLTNDGNCSCYIASDAFDKLVSYDISPNLNISTGALLTSCYSDCTQNNNSYLEGSFKDTLTPCNSQICIQDTKDIFNIADSNIGKIDDSNLVCCNINGEQKDTSSCGLNQTASGGDQPAKTDQPSQPTNTDQPSQPTNTDQPAKTSGNGGGTPFGINSSAQSAPMTPADKTFRTIAISVGSVILLAIILILIFL